MGRIARGAPIEGLFYHVMVRGNWGYEVFKDPADAAFFFDQLVEASRNTDATVHSDCIMPNHAHLLVRAGRKPLNELMKAPMERFAQRFNWKRGLKGHVFQDRFKAKLCKDDRYLMALIRYIPRNPVKAKLVRSPAEWPFSSYRAYLGGQDKLVKTDFCLSLFGEGREAVRRFREFIEDDDPGDLPEIDDFPPEPPAITAIAPRIEIMEGKEAARLQALIAEIAARSGVPLGELVTPRQTGRLAETRRAAMRQARAAGFSLRMIGNLMGISKAMVWRLTDRGVNGGVNEGTVPRENC